jgi:hypothetical protein
MNIIFGESREGLPDNYTILELDRFRIASSDQVLTAFCIVENIPLGDFPTLDAYCKVHADLMEAYRNRNWEYCQNAIRGLTGHWNGELDSFYKDLKSRVDVFSESDPGPDWDGIILK